jgi:hypothetical protein
MSMDFIDGVPVELRERNQWVVWRRQTDAEGRPTKVPYQASRPSDLASSTNAKTWASFDAAVSVPGVDGIGFVFTPDDPYCGLDVDSCIDSDGVLHPEADRIVQAFDSYRERSPSGTGLHVLIKGRLPDKGRSTSKTGWGGKIEAYDQGRYFTVTGNGSGKIAECQRELDELMARLFPAASRNGSHPVADASTATADGGRTPAVLLSDTKLRRLAKRSGKAPKDSSASGWDFALICTACRTVPELTRAEAMALLSYVKSKHGEDKASRDDYLERTVDRAFEAVGADRPVTPAGRPGGVKEALDAMSSVAGIAAHGVCFEQVRIVGQTGMRGSVDLRLSNGEELSFGSLRDLASARTLGMELTYAIGAEIQLDDDRIRRLVALLRTAAQRIQSNTDVEVSFMWAGYLQGVERLKVDLDVREKRWNALAQMQAIDDTLERPRVARMVLDHNGVLFVRSEWFCNHVRRLDPAVGPNSRIIDGMRRIGWDRPSGRDGRIRARDPLGNLPDIALAFLIVPRGWGQ